MTTLTQVVTSLGRHAHGSGGTSPSLLTPSQLEQVIGATDRRRGAIQENPLGPGDLAATVFQHLGIDPSGHWTNPAGRPVPLVEQGRSILQQS